MNHERIECHPLQPFLPNHARLLILGSFPPLQERWCMPFFYPNPQEQIPQCHDICCTGGKAAVTLAEILHCEPPKIGEFIQVDYAGRNIRFGRMPSSSRAYPLSLDKKVAVYQQMMAKVFTSSKHLSEN